MADFATPAQADAYLSNRAFTDKWSALADDTTKAKYLNLATLIINRFCAYYSDYDGDTPIILDNYTIAQYGLSKALQSACIEEALYLVNIGKDPTQVLSVLNLGISTTEGTTFDKSMIADILSTFSAKILNDDGFVIDAAVTSGYGSGIITK